MCLAEALLRIPDTDTADALIAEKIGERAVGASTSGASDSLFVNASTFGPDADGPRRQARRRTRARAPASVLKRLVARSGEPVIRQALRQAMRILGDKFVLGRTIEEALRARRGATRRSGYRFSYDMLGERAKTAADAERYFERYLAAIEAVGKAAGRSLAAIAHALMARPEHLGQALGHPSALRARQGGAARRASCCRASSSSPRAARRARPRPHRRRRGAGPPRPDARPVRARPSRDPALDGWPGLGLAVQAYGKRAMPVLRWLRRLSRARPASASPCASSRAPTGTARSSGRRSAGSPTIPCSRARCTPTCPISPACACCWPTRRAFYPAVRDPQRPHDRRRRTSRPADAPFEFQRLHGMGEALYEEVVGAAELGARLPHLCARSARTRTCVAYLVRRLLENGANTSFVNRLADERGAGRRDHARSRREPRSASAAEPRRGAAAAAARHLLPRAAQQRRPRADRADRARGAARARSAAELRALLRGRARSSTASDRRRRRGASWCSARTTGASASARCATADAGDDRDGDRSARTPPRTAGTGSAAPARADDPRAGRRPLRARPRAPDGRDRARGRQDAGERAGRRARGGRLPALLRDRGAAAVRRARSRCRARPARPTR